MDAGCCCSPRSGGRATCSSRSGSATSRPAMVAWLRIALAAAVLVPIAASQRALAGCRGRAGTSRSSAPSRWPGPFLLIAAGRAGDLLGARRDPRRHGADLHRACWRSGSTTRSAPRGCAWSAIVLGIAGVVALFGLDLGGSGSAAARRPRGGAGGPRLRGRRLPGQAPARPTRPPIGVAAWVMVAGTIWLLPAALLTAPGSVPALGPLAAVAALGVVGTGLAFAIFYTLIGRSGRRARSSSPTWRPGSRSSTERCCSTSGSPRPRLPAWR